MFLQKFFKPYFRTGYIKHVLYDLCFPGKQQGVQKPGGDAVQDKPVPEGFVAPKSKPVSWAALFKSNSNAPATNLPTVVSVNFEESESKNSGPEIQENSFPEKTQRAISVENDRDAAALAGLFH